MTKTYFKANMNIVNEEGPNQYYIMEVWVLDSTRPPGERMCIVNGQTMVDVEEKANLIAVALNYLHKDKQIP